MKSRRIRACLTGRDQKAIRFFLDYVKEKYGALFIRALLFGSMARGEAQEDSDIDVAILLKESNDRIKSDIYSFSGDVLLKFDRILSPLVFSRKEFEHLLKRERLLAREIQTEGIPL